MNAANQMQWREGSAVWVFDGLTWWKGTVLEGNSDFSVVRLNHGVSLPVHNENLRLRDPVCNGADRPPLTRELAFLDPHGGRPATAQAPAGWAA